MFHPKNLQILEKYKFNVEKSDEPSNVVWKNNNYTEGNKRQRKICSFVLPILLIAVTFLLLLGLNSKSTFGKTQCFDNQMTYAQFN